MGKARRRSNSEDWKVYFDGNFRGHHGRDHAGKEIAINKRFFWNGENWLIPAIYLCSVGVVADLCVEVEPERIRAFIEQWTSYRESGCEEEFSELYNPFNVHVYGKAELNGRILNSSGGSGMCWVPSSCRTEEDACDPDSERFVQHYSLDVEKGWGIRRLRFSWATKRKPIIKELKLALEQPPLTISGPKFKMPQIGESIRFKHPVTEVEHTLTVQACEKQELNISHPLMKDFEYPRHYLTMTYTLSPDIDNDKFSIQDCAKGEAPKSKNRSLRGTSSIGIIGGADGPTSVFIAFKGEEYKPYTACSSLYFEPVDEVQWKIVFREKMCEKIEVICYEGFTN